MLHVQALSTNYGAVAALKEVSIRVDEGEVVALIGANGVGKTTLLRTISGLLRPKAGTITFLGRQIQGLPPHRRVSLGLVQVPEGRQILGRMTVLENLEMGAYIRRGGAAVRADLDQILGRFPRLGERRHQLAGSLSGGEQQMLALGRALMARPKLLLLDEPSLGLAPLIVKEVLGMVAAVASEGMTVLLVEQNARQALKVAQRAYVLESGSLVLAGAAADLAADPRVAAAYLGGRAVGERA